MEQCTQIIDRLTRQVQNIDYRQVLANAQEALGVKEFNIAHMSPQLVRQIYQTTCEKNRKYANRKQELNWWENQLRLFTWILVCYIELKKTTLTTLDQRDWEFFSRIFPTKKQILFEYQVLTLQQEGGLTRKWEKEQDAMFRELVERREGKYKWSQLAKQLYIESEKKFFRTPKQCRERWLNHLDPNKSKQQWELKEDFVLISHVFSHGKKWAEVSKLLKSKRNEHAIKNRFKSLITKEEKHHQRDVTQAQLIEAVYKKYDNHFAKIRADQLETERREDINAAQMLTHSTIQTGSFQLLNPSLHVSQQFTFPSLNSFSSLRSIQQQQKQIRAEMFLSDDPFIFLRRFFKCRDS